MKIKPQWRGVVFGRTQAGKSYFTEYGLLPQFANIIVYAIKPADFASCGAVVRSIAELDNALKHGCNRLVYRASTLSDAEFSAFCRYIRLHVKNALVVVDEVHHWASKNRIDPEFKHLITVHQGEPYNLGVLSITQRPQNCHNDVLSQSTYWVMFQLDMADAEYIGNRLRVDPEQLAQLPPRHFAVYMNIAGSHGLTFYPPV